MCKMIQDKVANIAFINDGSMNSYKIEGLMDNVIVPNGILNINENLVDKQENKFTNLFEKVSKLYERKLILQKEMELINKEILDNETLLNSMY